MLLGGGYHGQRLNKIYRGVFAPWRLFLLRAEIVLENVNESQILAILRPMIKRYALERLPGERFGDFTIRAGYISAVNSGKEWYDGMGGEGKYAESLL
jgi:sulfite reductase (NADPH) hemoprotein beta-component